MNKIFKYELQTIPFQRIEMPKGAQILSIQNQNSNPRLWALVDTDADVEDRFIKMFSTGEEMNEGNSNLIHISTVQFWNGDLVFHFFELIIPYHD